MAYLAGVERTNRTKRTFPDMSAASTHRTPGGQDISFRNVRVRRVRVGLDERCADFEV